MNVKKVFQDIPRYEKQNDHVSFAQHEGRVLIKDPVTKVVLFEGWNKVILPGSFFTMRKHFPDIKVPVKLPTYNEVLDLDNTVALTEKEKADEQIFLFAMGTDVRECLLQQLDRNFTDFDENLNKKEVTLTLSLIEI